MPRTNHNSSEVLASRLRAARATELIAIVVTAGLEVDPEADRCHALGRPDQAFFIDRLGAAVAEHLVRRAVALLCQEVEAEGLSLLARWSPGYRGWDLADQPALVRLLGLNGAPRDPVVVLESGGLTPRHSLATVCGVAGRAQRAVPAWVECAACDLVPCGYRRAPYAGGAPTDVHLATERDDHR